MRNPAWEDEKSLNSGNKLSTESGPLTQGQHSAYIGEFPSFSSFVILEIKTGKYYASLLFKK